MREQGGFLGFLFLAPFCFRFCPPFGIPRLTAMASSSSSSATEPPLLETVKYLRQYGPARLQSEFKLQSKQHNKFPDLWLFKYKQTQSDFSVRIPIAPLFPFYAANVEKETVSCVKRSNIDSGGEAVLKCELQVPKVHEQLI